MAGGAAGRSLGRVARRRRSRGGARAEIPGTAAHRRGPGGVAGPSAPATGAGNAARPDPARSRAAQATWLQSERGAGAGAGAPVGSRGGAATPCQSAQYTDADGVDTGGSPGERV